MLGLLYHPFHDFFFFLNLILQKKNWSQGDLRTNSIVNLAPLSWLLSEKYDLVGRLLKAGEEPALPVDEEEEEEDDDNEPIDMLEDAATTKQLRIGIKDDQYTYNGLYPPRMSQKSRSPPRGAYFLEGFIQTKLRNMTERERWCSVLHGGEDVIWCHVHRQGFMQNE